MERGKEFNGTWNWMVLCGSVLNYSIASHWAQIDASDFSASAVAYIYIYIPSIYWVTKKIFNDDAISKVTGEGWGGKHSCQWWQVTKLPDYPQVPLNQIFSFSRKFVISQWSHESLAPFDFNFRNMYYRNKFKVAWTCVAPVFTCLDCE